jgi:histidine ammonia-lyase
MTTPLILGGGDLTADDIRRMAEDDAPIAFSPEALAAVAANRAAPERAIEGGAHVYGITTGLGGLHGAHVPIDKARRAQVWLLRSHAAGTGPELPREVVRAAMLIRAMDAADVAAAVSIDALLGSTPALDSRVHALFGPSPVRARAPPTCVPWWRAPTACACRGEAVDGFKTPTRFGASRRCTAPRVKR